MPRPVHRAVGLVLAAVAVGAVVVRQLATSSAQSAPTSDAEVALGVNAYALLHPGELGVPSSLPETVTSWQIAGYALVTSANARHESLLASTREFVLVTAILTAILTVLLCRRLRLGWLSTALGVAVFGLPAAAGLLRLTSVPGTAAAFWLALAGLCGVAAAEMARQRLPLIVLSGIASSLAIVTAPVSALVVVGVALGLVGTRRLGRGRTGARALTLVGLSGAGFAVSWLVVSGPSSPGELPAVGAGWALAVGGLIVAGACWPIIWMRPLAVGAVPILLVTAWPGPAQPAAVILGLYVVALLIAGLLDSLLSRPLPSVARALGAVSLLAAVAVGASIFPPPTTVPVSAIPSGDVATWIRTHLAPDAIVEVEPLARAQLVAYGLDPDRLSSPPGPDDDAGGQAAYLLTASDGPGELPVVVQFGTGGTAMALRLVVADPAAYAAALVVDQASRSRFGTALAGNPNLRLSGPAAAALRAGEVDARLMVCLAGAATIAEISINEFASPSGTAPSARIFREATLTEISELGASSQAPDPSGAARRGLAQFFAAQQPPYQPLAVIETLTSLTVRFEAPAPLGLLP